MTTMGRGEGDGTEVVDETPEVVGSGGWTCRVENVQIYMVVVIHIRVCIYLIVLYIYNSEGTIAEMNQVTNCYSSNELRNCDIACFSQ